MDESVSLWWRVDPELLCVCGMLAHKSNHKMCVGRDLDTLSMLVFIYKQDSIQLAW